MISHGIILNFAPELYTIFFVNTKKLSSDLKSLQFLKFSAKCCEFKIGERNGHGKSRNGQVFCQVCGNPGSASLYQEGHLHKSIDGHQVIFTTRAPLPVLDRSGE